MALQFRAIINFSTVPQMLNEADFLIDLAQAQSSQDGFHQSTLAASASLVLAVCLDQATLSVLDLAAQTARAAERPNEAAPYEKLLVESLRRRVMRLPEVATCSRFQLDSQSAHVRALHDLVTLRNDLMHVAEEADVSDVDIRQPLEFTVTETTNRGMVQIRTG